MEKQDLKKAGLKITAPRTKILALLEAATTRHLSAEDVYRQLIEAGDDIGLATVYRVLTQFESAGLVRRHHFESGHSVFELEDGGHHDHIVCIRCGRVEEFINQTIERLQQEVAQKAGYEITDHNLCIYGICQDCQKKKS